MAARALALLAAVAMVVGAIVVRNALDADEGANAGGPLLLVCDTALATVCEAVAGNGVDIQVEDAFATFERLVDQAPGAAPALDGWLVTAPWPGMVAAAEQRAGREAALLAGEVLARSPVVLAVRSERRRPLTERCGAEIDWKCVGEVAGTPWSSLPGGDATWGPVRPAHPPSASTAGLTVLGAGAVSYFDGRTDLSSADLDDGGFQDWLSRLERSRPRPGDTAPLQTLLRQPSAYDLVGTLEADAGPSLVTTVRPDKPDLLYPLPVVTADVVLAVGQGAGGERMARTISGNAVLAALAAAGWRVPGQRRAPGVSTTPALPPASNLPDPDVLEALLDTAARVAG